MAEGRDDAFAGGSRMAASSSGDGEADSTTVPSEGQASAKIEGEGCEDEPARLMQFLLCAIAAVEGSDIAMLGSAKKAIIQDIGLTLIQFSYMMIAQLVLTNLAAPFWGILADRGVLRRRTILLMASVGQGCSVIALAFMPNLAAMVVCRAIDGFLLAALRPISNGIVADVTVEHRRGKIFGRLQSAMIMGMFVTTLYVVPMAQETVMGFQGWRVAFAIVGVIAVLTGALVAFLLVEPPHEDYQGKGGLGAIWDEIKSLLHFFRLPTFSVMIMQGVFGTIPWSVMGEMVLFFQLAGVRNELVVVLQGAQTVAGAIGNLIGGLVADALSVRLGLHGRPLNAQITVGAAIPILYFIFAGIPAGQGNFWTYLVLLVAFGLLGSWAQSGTNFPILSHIVPASCRSRVLAWESAVENSIAFGVGPVIVAQLAEKVFGYTFGQDTKEGVDIPSAQALGKAMALTMCGPMSICFIVYSAMHYTYPRDMRLLQAQQEAAANHSIQEGEHMDAKGSHPAASPRGELV